MPLCTYACKAHNSKEVSKSAGVVFMLVLPTVGEPRMHEGDEHQSMSLGSTTPEEFSKGICKMGSTCK